MRKVRISSKENENALMLFCFFFSLMGFSDRIGLGHITVSSVLVQVLSPVP
jgi:hypothetical protein